MLKIAHRGASKHAPENTMAAFYKAHELGAKWIECDVGLSLDKVPVIIHDDSLNRTTDMKVKLNRQFYEHIRQADAGSWFDKKYHNEKIPHLEEVLEFIVQYDMYLNLEIKKMPVQELHAGIDVILNTLQKYNVQERILLSSFQLEILLDLKRRKSIYPRAYLVNRPSPQALEAAKESACVQINCAQRYVMPKYVKLCHEQGLKIGVYTVNDVTQMAHLEQLGVDAVFTDDSSLIGQKK